MENLSVSSKRRTFRWPAAAREAVAANFNARGPQLRELVTKLVGITGYPRAACLRFARRMGLKAKGQYKKWPPADQERLLELLDKYSVAEAAEKMRRSKASIYALLRRLNLGSSFRQDCFSKRRLAELLHIHMAEVDSWIRHKWLNATVIQVGQVTRTMIKPEDFCRFCEQHRDKVVGNRLNIERLDFVYSYVYPPDHNRLLQVRQSKKERAAFEESHSTGDPPEEPEQSLWESTGAPGCPAP